MSRTKKRKRFKTEEELTPNERLKRLRGEQDRFETAEYRQARENALADAGLEDDPDREINLDDIAEEDLTPDERFQRLQNERIR